MVTMLTNVNDDIWQNIVCLYLRVSYFFRLWVHTFQGIANPLQIYMLVCIIMIAHATIYYVMKNKICLHV